MLAPQATIKRKKGSPKVKGEFCPFTLKIKVATLEQAVALRALYGAMTQPVAAGISKSVMFYPTKAVDVFHASAAFRSVHDELLNQGVPDGQG